MNSHLGPTIRRSDGHRTAWQVNAKVRAIAALTLCLAVLMAGCGDDDPLVTAPTGPSASSVAISGTPSGERFQLTAMARLSDGSTRDVTTVSTWESSNAAVARVALGLVQVVGPGEVEIKAVFQGTTGTLRLTLTPVAVSGLEIEGEPAPASFFLRAMARLADGTREEVTLDSTWESSDPRVAVVSSTGLVTIVGSGEVRIQATYKGVSASRTFTLAPAGFYEVRGEVRSSVDGQPLAGAEVRLLNRTTLLPVITDATGAFAFERVLEGRILIEATRTGYLVTSRDAFVSGPITVVLTMVPAPTAQRTQAAGVR